MLVSSTDIAWLAGIIDGEGSITMGLEKKTGHYNSMLHICNTDIMLITRCIEIIVSLDCKFSLFIRKPSKGHIGKKNIAYIQVSAHEDLLKLLQEICPYLQSIKRERAELMMVWLESRIPKRNVGSSASRVYTDDERELASRIRAVK